LPTAKPYATGEKNLVSARISYKKNWCHTSACIVGKCEWHEIYAIGLKVKALLCCLQLRSGSESGLARMNPMLDFAAATFLMSSETNEAIQRCFTISTNTSIHVVSFCTAWVHGNSEMLADVHTSLPS